MEDVANVDMRRMVCKRAKSGDTRMIGLKRLFFECIGRIESV